MIFDRDGAARAAIAAGVLLIAFVALMLATAAAPARDAGRWEGSDPSVREWFNSIKQPDNPSISCCGEADAYWADTIETKDGQLVAVVTDDRDDAPLRRQHVPIGTRIVVPAHKITWRFGNPTGHSVIFLSRDLSVYCFVQNGGV